MLFIKINLICDWFVGWQCTTKSLVLLRKHTVAAASIPEPSQDHIAAARR